MSDAFSAQLLRQMEEDLSDSGDEVIMNDTELELEVEYKMIRGMRENSQLVWAFKENNLYYRNVLSKKTGIHACKCYKPGCSARLYIRKDESAFRHIDVDHDKIHGSMYTEYMMMHCYNKMKDKAVTAPASTTPFQIYQEIVAE